jgi:hypothetical protein
MKTILLISPDTDNEALWVSGEEGPDDKILNNFLPLGLATVAALTPPEFHVDIWDELVHGRLSEKNLHKLKRDYDLVGLTGYFSHLSRLRRLAALFRKRGIPVVVGGPGVSSSPVTYRGEFDVLFCGEAEKTWPQFLQDWQRGSYKSEYRQIEKPDLAESPMPRWDSIEDVFPNYAMGCVQTTRGCPFDCEFCDVIYLFGRRSRHKPIDRVLGEVQALERLGVKTIMFCDDEFIGDPRHAKELLRALIPLNNSFAEPLSYSTQLTMNLSRDEELLRLIADANFNLVFIGIETPNQESLQETGKFQNVRKDLVADVHKILSYGIAIRSGVIVGFDHDGPNIFDIQYEFIQKACLQSLAINMLKAPLQTKLWSRLRQEGRVVDLSQARNVLGHPRSYTNILPKMMSRVELLQGYRDLLVRVHEWSSFSERIRGFVSLVRRPPQVRERPLSAEEALRLCDAPGQGPEAARAIEEIIRHTEAVAPYMMRRVKVIIVQYQSYLKTLKDLIPHLDWQIRLESSGKFAIAIDHSPIVIPPGFRSAYGQVFPEIHARVYANLIDRALVAEALTEVFVDFLVKWGPTFERLEPYHKAFLEEICDRTCARLNGQPPQDFVPRPAGEVDVPSVKRSRLGDDVLKCVGEELIKVNRLASPATDCSGTRRQEPEPVGIGRVVQTAEPSPLGVTA